MTFRARRIRVTAPDPAWPERARQEAERLANACAPALLEVHHIGSTAIPGLPAKPIIDLIGVAAALPDIEARRRDLEALGYRWRGENGIAGRRFCTLIDLMTGERKVHLHCFARGDPAIDRHLAFRDYLRMRPDIAAEYGRLKQACAVASAGDPARYAACKGEWVAEVERAALAAMVKRQALRPPPPQAFRA